MPRPRKARYLSTASVAKPGVPEYVDLETVDEMPRQLYVLEGNTGRVQIGTTADFPGLLKAVFRNNGMAEGSYFVSVSSNRSVYALRELRAFCVDNSAEHLELNLFDGADFLSVAEKASSILPGKTTHS